MRNRVVVGLALALMLAVPGLCQAQNALIVDNVCDPVDGGPEGANLQALLTAQGFAVTRVATMPGSLAGYRQVWDIRCQTALTASDTSAFTTYLSSGGSLFVMGENTGYAPVRNASIVSFISSLGGPSLTVGAAANSQTVHAPFTGPTAVSTVSFRAVAGAVLPPGGGASISSDASAMSGAMVFGPGRLSAAPAGSLIVVFDVNFLDNHATLGETALANNMIAYLAAPVPVPALPTWALALLALVATASGAWVLRRGRHAPHAA